MGGNKMTALTFDEALEQYVAGKITIEQFTFIALKFIKKDIEEVKQRMLDKE